MSDYGHQVEQIRRAQSLDELADIARQFSAIAQKNGAVLYSGLVNDKLHSETVAKAIAEAGDLAIINGTPRGMFLGDKEVSDALDLSARRILVSEGVDPVTANKLAGSFLFGDRTLENDSRFSVRRSLWGETSRDFANSVRGDVTVVGVSADAKRVLGVVEIESILANREVTSFGGRQIEYLRTLHAQGGIDAVLPEIQTQFIRATPQVFTSGLLPADAKVGWVSVTREFASSMEIEAPGLKSESDLLATGFRRAAPALEAYIALANQPAPTRGFGAVAFKGAIAGGSVLSAVDAVNTGERIDTLLAQDNLLGAKHEVRDFAVNNANAWAAAYAVSKIGAEMGSRRGPTGAILGGIAGGITGYVLSEKAIQGLDGREIRNQSDSLGRSWTFNNREWVRPMDADLQVDGVARLQSRDFAADFDTRRELDFRATNTSVEIALRRLPPPQKPHSLPPGEQDAVSSRPSDWQRNPETGQWTRAVYGPEVERGIASMRLVPASPERAAELDAQSREVIRANIENGPAPIAARYDIAYRLNGWAQVPGVARSAAAVAALDTENLQASNGRQYQLGADGIWRNGKDVADGNITAELSATRDALRPQVERHLLTMDSLPDWQRPTQGQQDVASLAATYAAHGVAPFPETLDAIQVAVRDTRTRAGLDAGTTSLSLDPDALQRRDIYSPILHLQLDASGAVQVAAITSGDDIRRALEEVRLRGPEALASRPDESIRTLGAVAAVQPSREELREQSNRDNPVEPRRAALLADDPKHPDFDTFNRIHQWVRGTGQWDDEKSRNVAATLYRAQADDPLMKRVDAVAGAVGRDGSQNVFAVYAPFGDKDPFFHAKVDGREAAQQPALQNLEQAEQLRQSQQQTLQQREQTQLQERRSQTGVALTM